jgi:hypothetical protein
MKTNYAKQALTLALALTVAVGRANAQGIAIGDRDFTPNAAAMLDVQAKNKGVLIPRMTYTERMYIQTNAQSLGLLVYQTDREAGFYYWDGLSWKYLAPPQSVQLPNFAAVATSGDYNDLTNKPAISGGTLELAAVATTGSYSDLTDKPTIPARLQDLEQDENYYTTVSRAERERWDAAAAGSQFSGSYSDLTDKPTIPTRLQDLQQDENYYTTVSRAERELWNGKANTSDILTRLQDLQQDENY